MKNLELEKILQKLEKLDIREWTADNLTSCIESISVKTEGIEFCLKKETPGLGAHYSLSIKNTGDEVWVIEYLHDKEDRVSKKLIREFYEKTNTRIMEYKTKQLKEKLNNFVSE